MNELDRKTLEAVKNDKQSEWRNKIFKCEIEGNKINVISKRKTMEGKGFTVPSSKELGDIPSDILEKFIFNKYTTEIYLYL